MHFYMFNPADFNNSARHLSLPERAIYRDLIDMYYNTEQAIDASDMDGLARRLLCTTPEYRASLDYILAEYFTKRGKRHHHHRIDKEIKNYKNSKRNADGNAVTNDVTQGVTLGNASRNVTCNDDDTPMTAAERTRKSRQHKQNMIDSLISIGLTVDKNIKTAALKALYAKHSNAVTRNNALDVTQAVTSSNEQCNASNAKNAAITSNQELLTNNHKPVRESDAHTNTGEVIVDKFNHGSVDNSFADSQYSETQPVPVNSLQPTEPVATQPVTKAEQVCSQNADDIENWEAPTIDTMRGELFRAGKMMQLTDDQYALHLEDFKAHYAAQALIGKPLGTDSLRKSKLRKWLATEVDSQAASQARQEKAKGTFNIDNEDWSTTTNRPTQSNSDIPDVFHPSQAEFQPVEPVTYVPAMNDPNWRWTEPLPGMSIIETDRHIKENKFKGENPNRAYQRLLAEMQGAQA